MKVLLVIEDDGTSYLRTVDTTWIGMRCCTGAMSRSGQRGKGGLVRASQCKRTP